MGKKRILAALGAASAAAAGTLAVSYFSVFARCRDMKEDVPPPVREDVSGRLAAKYGELHSAACALEGESIGLRSRDGIELRGKFYRFSGEGPVMLFFHGYHGHPLRDGCGMMKLARELGTDVLVPDQRAHGESGGRTITFGVREQYDCLDWIQYLLDRFGSGRKIILSGVSMGASTVLMAADRLPGNVAGIIADCGYTTAEAIIRHVSRQIRLPEGMGFALAKADARLFGGVDLSAASAPEALVRCRAPVLFIHGEGDSFVPADMSRENYEACTAPKRFLTVPGAEHAMSFLVDEEAYTTAVKEFLSETAT